MLNSTASCNFSCIYCLRAIMKKSKSKIKNNIETLSVFFFVFSCIPIVYEQNITQYLQFCFAHVVYDE